MALILKAPDRSLHGGWAVLLTTVALVLAFIVLGVGLSYWQGLRDLRAQAMLLAGEVLERSHAIREQIDHAVIQLEAHRELLPCSVDSITLMRRIGLSEAYLQMIGYVSENQLQCSSYGVFDPPVDVGPAVYLSARGYNIRPRVRLPFAGATEFLISTSHLSGYAAVVNARKALDLQSEDERLALGLFSMTARTPIIHRGVQMPAWLSLPLDGQGRGSMLADGWLLGVQASPRFGYAAYAALPTDRLPALVTGHALTVVPLSLAAGLSLALLVSALMRRQHSIDHLLQLALANDELFLVYQPVIDMASGRWTGAEALVRWRRPNSEMVPPDVFIPAAEKSGLIRRVTDRVIEHAEQDMLPLLHKQSGLHLSINLSAADIADMVVVQRLCGLVSSYGLQPGQLAVEVTERVLVKGDEAHANIHLLREAGIEVWIDDFGTGYAGLSYLRQMELDVLKIDKAFIDPIGTDAVTSGVVLHIIAIAGALGLRLVAEGVESAEQADYLCAHGVPCAQGWYYSRPLSAAQFRKGVSVSRGSS